MSIDRSTLKKIKQKKKRKCEAPTGHGVCLLADGEEDAYGENGDGRRGRARQHSAGGREERFLDLGGLGAWHRTIVVERGIGG